MEFLGRENKENHFEDLTLAVKVGLKLSYGSSDSFGLQNKLKEHF